VVAGQYNEGNHWTGGWRGSGSWSGNGPWSGNRGNGWHQGQPYKHMAVFSVDGMHASDVEKYLVVRPKSNISLLLATGYEYTNAYTSAPSDSFPGTMAQWTGGTPAVTGVWYDDTWDRSWYAPGSNCQGPPGAESKLSWRRCCQTQVLTRALQLPMTKASITIAHKSSPAGLILLTYQKL